MPDKITRSKPLTVVPQYQPLTTTRHDRTVLTGWLFAGHVLWIAATDNVPPGARRIFLEADDAEPR